MKDTIYNINTIFNLLVQCRGLSGSNLSGEDVGKWTKPMQIRRPGSTASFAGIRACKFLLNGQRVKSH